MNRSRATAAVALSLCCVVGAVAPAAAADVLPYAPKDTRPVRIGDVLTVAVPAGEVANGLPVRSKAFLADGVLRMHAPRLTATVAVTCEAKPGVYEVELGTEGALPYTRVRVEEADEAARRECRTKLSDLPPVSQEERWDDGAPWPQSPWDVREVPAGGRITASDSGAVDGEDSLSSPGFAEKAVLRGGKNVLTADATVSCDAKPGLYSVHKNGEREVWARYRVTAATSRCASSSSPTAVAPWAVGGTGALAAGLGAFVLVRRRRRQSSTTSESPGDTPTPE
ncbi:hypothetical protein AB0M39_08920 [Streptomyces sp. NPDC051907]|uniref:hypothetical protein n=1 Tax=Streptomyces sp. NPDC051907 TaxID=3155284 RepID=UPI00343BB54E